MADNTIEDAVRTFLLDEENELKDMVTWRVLVLRHPHWPRQLVEMDRMLNTMRKKALEAK